MYDSKVVRRRRAALAVFVALSIAILTAYFGESGGGFFHTLQRGAQERSPDRDGREPGAQASARPVRLDRRHVRRQEREQGAGREVERLRAALAEAQTSQRDAAQLKGLVGLSEQDGFPRGPSRSPRA